LGSERHSCLDRGRPLPPDRLYGLCWYGLHVAQSYDDQSWSSTTGRETRAVMEEISALAKEVLEEEAPLIERKA
jgi:hypothetical protein